MKTCAWCHLEKDSGQKRQWGLWICHECFPPEGGKKVWSSYRRCEACSKHDNAGEVINGRWLCSECVEFISERRGKHGKRTHKNKYPQFSLVEGGAERPKKKKKKEKWPKLKEIKSWVVEIIELNFNSLSDGEVCHRLFERCQRPIKCSVEFVAEGSEME